MQSTYILNHVHAFATQCSPLRCQVSPVARGWIDEAESLRERRSYMRHIQSYFAERLARMFLILGSCGLRGRSQELEIVSSKFSTANHNNVSTKKNNGQKEEWTNSKAKKSFKNLPEHFSCQAYTAATSWRYPCFHGTSATRSDRIIAIIHLPIRGGSHEHRVTRYKVSLLSRCPLPL